MTANRFTNLDVYLAVLVSILATAALWMYIPK
jgi:hypothetical protein